MNLVACTTAGGEHRFTGKTARVLLTCLVLLNAACAQLSAVDKPLAQWTPEL